MISPYFAVRNRCRGKLNRSNFCGDRPRKVSEEKEKVVACVCTLWPYVGAELGLDISLYGLGSFHFFFLAYIPSSLVFAVRVVSFARFGLVSCQV